MRNSGSHRAQITHKKRVSIQTARRLAITKQRLAGGRPSATSDGLLETVRSIGCLQIDPTKVVARTQHLVLWSRLGEYDTTLLDKVAYEDRSLFEYWGHAWSYVLAEHLPIHRLRMTSYARGNELWAERVRTWMKANDTFRRYVMSQLKRHGPLPAKALEDRSVVPWPSSGWTNERNVSRMLDFLSVQGKALVSARRGQNRLWDIGERCIAGWAPRDKLSESEAVRRAAEISLKTLGVARMPHIRENFTRGMYPNLTLALKALEREGRLVPLAIEREDASLSDGWWVHHDDLKLIDEIKEGLWEPRMSLLSPFDNLIADRKRLKELFDLDYRIEIYVPVAKRKYGFFVLPILDGDRFIGRIDPYFDRATGTFTIKAVHEEPGAPWTRRQKKEVAQTIQGLGSWLGATSVKLP